MFGKDNDHYVDWSETSRTLSQTETEGVRNECSVCKRIRVRLLLHLLLFWSLFRLLLLLLL